MHYDKENIGLLDKFLIFISKKSRKNKKNNSKETKFKSIFSFEQYLEVLNKNDKNYNKVKTACTLIEEDLKIIKQKSILSNQLKSYENILAELKQYNLLNEDDRKYLSEITIKYLSLIKDKKSVMYQKGGFSSNLEKLENVKDDAQKVLSDMKDAEKQKRILKKDIVKIQVEKNRLEEEAETISFILKILKKFSIILTCIFFISILVLVYFQLAQNINVSIQLLVVLCLLLFLFVFIYFFQRKMNFEIKLNRKAQIKVIQILNKKNIVYSHYLNFLNYIYKKYRVRNSKILKNQLDEFENYTYISNRYKSISRILFETKSQLEQILKEKSIYNPTMSLEKFAKTVNIDDKLKYCKEIEEQIDKSLEKIEEFDFQHDRIWAEIIQLDVEDTTENKVIGKMIDCYLEAVKEINGTIIEEDVDKNEEL